MSETTTAPEKILTSAEKHGGHPAVELRLRRLTFIGGAVMETSQPAEHRPSCAKPNSNTYGREP